MTAHYDLKPPNWTSDDRGIYCLLLYLPKRTYVKAGRLGGVYVEPGFVLYVGRAQRNLFARLGRHMRRRKPRRWHIDYLFPAAAPLGAFVLDMDGVRECDIAARLASRPDVRRVIPGFGASDCRCQGHLLWSPDPKGRAGPAAGRRASANPPFHLAGATFFPASAW